MRRRGAEGFSLVELLTVVGIFGCVSLGVSTAMILAGREAREASRVAGAREQRWETVRRLRADAQRAGQARLVRGPEGGSGLELSGAGGRVLWLASAGELLRVADGSPPVQPVPLAAGFELERAGGRLLVRYRLGEGEAVLEGRALVGAAP